jgi:hypothetical protein
MQIHLNTYLVHIHQKTYKGVSMYNIIIEFWWVWPKLIKRQRNITSLKAIWSMVHDTENIMCHIFWCWVELLYGTFNIKFKSLKYFELESKQCSINLHFLCACISSPVRWNYLFRHVDLASKINAMYCSKCLSNTIKLLIRT